MDERTKNRFKISADDPFNFQKSVKGFNLQLMFMYSQIYHFYYTFAFKRHMIKYDYYDMFEELSDADDYFLKIEDPYVINGVKIRKLMIDCHTTLVLRFGIDVEDDLDDQQILAESQRRSPFVLQYKHPKSYKKLRFYYERTVTSQIRYLHDFACIFTASKYRIPLVLKRQYNLPYSISFKLLNDDDDTVKLIIELIKSLMPLYQEIRMLNLPRLPKGGKTVAR